MHTLFADTVRVTAGPVALSLPDLVSVRPVAVGVAVVAAFLVFGVRWSVLRTLGACAVLGLVAGLAGLPVT